MLTGGISLAAEKVAEVLINASEVADFGAVKPDGFGSLIKERTLSEIAKPQMDNLYLSEFPQINTRINLFGSTETKENPYLCICYNEVSKECSEYLCDYGITPWAWQEATLEQRMDMLRTATKIMANELKLPEEWISAIEPTIVSNERYMAAASCRIRLLSNGGVNIIGVPTLNVNIDYLTDDYFEAMTTIYHEMIHVKQYASIDCIIPELTTDSRLLDLINELKISDGNFTSNVSYLYSPYEAEAWAQESYFKRMLQAVIQERYL